MDNILTFSSKDIIRFFDKIKKTRSCWVWIAAKRKTGYGCFKHRGKVLDSHRISWTLEKGDIPKGKWVLHKCDNPICVRPSHLFLGTPRDNVLDMIAKGRWTPAMKGKRQVTHGMATMYNKYHCRCRKCTDAVVKKIYAWRLVNPGRRK